MVSDSENPLVVSSDFFDPDHLFSAKCQVEDPTNHYAGAITARYNTYDFSEDFNFTVNAITDEDYRKEGSTEGMFIDHSSGEVHTMEHNKNVPFMTQFAMTVIKPVGEALKCEFGYFNDAGYIVIED